jgi:hypothetical protein
VGVKNGYEEQALSKIGANRLLSHTDLNSKEILESAVKKLYEHNLKFELKIHIGTVATPSKTEEM